MTNPQPKAGDFFGNLRIIQRVPDDMQTRSPNLKKRVRVECVCGKRETIPQYYLTRKPNPKQDCGCGRKTIRTTHNDEYRIWLMMHVRCYDPTHIAYKHYGGRGIGVCPEWHRGEGDSPSLEAFARFLAFVGPRPSPTHSIDRVDNNVGYQPYGNDGSTRQVRWATAVEQRANQRKPEETKAA
jgi:hypothetical protein